LSKPRRMRRRSSGSREVLEDELGLEDALVLDSSDARAEAQAQHGEGGEIDLGIAVCIGVVLFDLELQAKAPRAEREIRNSAGSSTRCSLRNSRARPVRAAACSRRQASSKRNSPTASPRRHRMGGASDNRRWSVDARRSSAAVCGRVRSALHQAPTAPR
jgi:hypothetical protein